MGRSDCSSKITCDPFSRGLLLVGGLVAVVVRMTGEKVQPVSFQENVFYSSAAVIVWPLSFMPPLMFGGAVSLGR